MIPEDLPEPEPDEIARRITALHERRHRRIGNLTTEIDLPISEMMAALDVAYVPNPTLADTSPSELA